MVNNNKQTEAITLLFDIQKIIKRSMRGCFENLSMTLPQHMVVGTLIKHGELKLTELSSMLNLSNSTITGIIDRLEKQELVLRVRSEIDRRIINVKLTPSAHEIYRGIFDKAADRIQELLRPGSQDDIDQIYAGLTTLKKILMISSTEGAETC